MCLTAYMNGHDKILWFVVGVRPEEKPESRQRASPITTVPLSLVRLQGE